MNKTKKKINQWACYNRIWSWSPMPCEKHGPRASVTTKTSAFGLGFCLLSPSGHVFHTAWETMIKSYNKVLPDKWWSSLLTYIYIYMCVCVCHQCPISWICNYINYKVWDKITTHPSTNYNSGVVWVGEWISNLNPHITRCMVIYPNYN